jgi:hypothetical protein
MSGFRTLGFLLLAPFMIGGLVIGIFGFDEYNIIIIPLVMFGEAILVLAGIIDVEENKVEESHGINTIDNSNKDGEKTTKPAM